MIEALTCVASVGWLFRLCFLVQVLADVCHVDVMQPSTAVCQAFLSSLFVSCLHQQAKNLVSNGCVTLYKLIKLEGKP